MTASLAVMLLPTLVGVTVLCGLSVLVLALAGATVRLAPATAVLRAAVQLGAVSVLLTGVLSNPWWVAVALLVMVSVAVATATRRVGWPGRAVRPVAASIAGGAVAAMAVVFGSGTLPLTGRYLLALGGIVVGNAMAITALTARRFLQAADERWDEVEGWLALGATPREATRPLARSAVELALIPTIDQTKTTGLVTLPGAFVGAIFGGLSPLEAGRFQVVVLASILAAGSISAVVVVRMLATLERRPVGRSG